jgi:hypothetical protein
VNIWMISKNNTVQVVTPLKAEGVWIADKYGRESPLSGSLNVLFHSLMFRCLHDVKRKDT